MREDQASHLEGSNEVNPTDRFATVGSTRHLVLGKFTGMCFRVLCKSKKASIRQNLEPALKICVSKRGLNVVYLGKEVRKETDLQTLIKWTSGSRGILGAKHLVIVDELDLKVQYSVKNPTMQNIGLYDLVQVLSGERELPKKATEEKSEAPNVLATI